jgi:molecular chaperone HtpG
MSEITFQVETSRVLQILTKEIYDSPLALLRENVQNAYDAIRMRFAGTPSGVAAGRIDVNIGPKEISIADNGIGMSEHVLRDNFWKPGSSGKHSQKAREAGVVGTFGIGAMANFGVCSKVSVETRADEQPIVLLSIAELATLKVGEKCISLEPIDSGREVGSTVTAILNENNAISEAQARQYLDPYVGLLPVPVFLNGTLISGGALEAKLPTGGRNFTTVAKKTVGDSSCSATLEISVDPNGQVKVIATDIKVDSVAIEGKLALVQSGGQLFGLRSSFGLAPIPVAGHFQFGGLADLSFLVPTAGREALSRESITQVARLVAIAEQAAVEALSQTQWADRNVGLMQWILAFGRLDLAGRISMHVIPDETDVALADVQDHIGKRNALFYSGVDQQIIRTFGNESTALLLVAQNPPRRNVHLQYIQRFLKISEVPNAAQVTRTYSGIELSVAEASVLVRIGSILRDDYLVPDLDIALSDISHGVTVLAEKTGEQVRVRIARNSPLLPPVLEFYGKAYDLFTQFMKDFVRVHIYPRLQQFVPSSTRDGVDALRRLLERNRELYRYEETERGDVEIVLGDFLAGTAQFSDVLKASRSAVRVQSQSVSSEQVGTIEQEIPGVVQSPVQAAAADGAEHLPAPPIVRDDLTSDKKILTSSAKHPQLNGFCMLLGVSDRLMKTESEFFRTPHTTRIMWGGQRVIYIFTEATGRLSLYYDIELRNSIDSKNTSGGMFRTTTLITKKRIFIPVPDALVEEFKIISVPREFFVRFDVLVSPAGN